MEVAVLELELALARATKAALSRHLHRRRQSSTMSSHLVLHTLKSLLH